MKNFKKVLALVLAVVMMLSVAVTASAKTGADYKDAAAVKASDYQIAIDVLTYLGIMEGDDANNFNPKDNLTREQAAKLIAILDNGDTDIADLYTSTCPFADVIGRWSASYVGYCYRMGIVVGPRENWFEPKDNVTGTQFLKMALTVLDLDAEREGYVGTSWAANTLADAKELGLTYGLKDFDPAADLTREEAAQILFNLLWCDKFEYGQAIRYFADGIPGDDFYDGPYMSAARFITDSGAYPAGNWLSDFWGLNWNHGQDEFMRPTIEMTIYDDVIGAYMEAPIAEYTAAVSGCQILVDAGIPKTNTTKTADYLYHVNGAAATNGTLKHEIEDTAHCTMEGEIFGGKGTLTQVFEGENGLIITSIETWLGRVETVNKANAISKDGHITAAANLGTVKVFDCPKANEYCDDCEIGTVPADTTGFKKGDYVLLTYSFKSSGIIAENTYGESNNGELSPILIYRPHPDGNDPAVLPIGIVTLTAPKTVNGTLTGFVDKQADDAAKYTSTRIDGADYADSFHFHLHYGRSKTYAALKAAYTFFFDTYGNVIGLTDIAAEDNTVLGVGVKAYGYWTEGNANIKATFVTMDAKLNTGDVAGYLKSGVLKTPADAAETLEVYADPVSYDFEDARAYNDFYNELGAFTVDKDGKYIFQEVDHVHLEMITFQYELIKGDPNLYEGSDWKVRTNENTVFLLKDADGFKSYNGYKEVPSCLLTHVDYILPAGSNYATVVFGEVIAYDDAAGTAVAFIPNPVRRDTKVINGVTYDLYDAYVNGEKTVIYLGPGDKTLANGGAGFYMLGFAKNADDVYVATATKVTSTTDPYSIVNTVAIECTITALYVSSWNAAINITDVPVYCYDATLGTVKPGTTADVEGDIIMLINDDTLAAIYVVDETL